DPDHDYDPEREAQIETDRPGGRAGEVVGAGEAAEIVLHEDDVGALQRDIRAGPHRDPDICGDQGGGIVDAVPDHRDAPLALQISYGRHLLLGEELGPDLVDPE